MEPNSHGQNPDFLDLETDHKRQHMKALCVEKEKNAAIIEVWTLKNWKNEWLRPGGCVHQDNRQLKQLSRTQS
jgi:hypothetical protein